jgi:transposase
MDKQISNSDKTMPVHTPLNEPSKFVEAFARKHGLTIMDWPANSPDLSPIENLWAHLKDKLRKQYHDTATLKGSAQTIKATL